MIDMQVVVFELLDELCAVETFQVKEILRYQEVTKIPEMPDFIEGMINLRDRVIPIINLDTKFHLGRAKNPENGKIIITTINDQNVGFVVDNVIEILRLTDEHLEDAPEIIRKWGKKYIKCVAKIKDKLVNVLDLNSVLTDEQLEHIISLDAE